MRWLQLALLAVPLGACGGSAAHSAKDSPSLGGGAGEPSVGISGAGGAAVAAAGGGAAGSPSRGGTGGAAGAGVSEPAAGAAGAGVSEPAAGAAGQAGQTACSELGCLAGAELIYEPNRQWQGTAAGPPHNIELAEADYTPLQGPTWRVVFSSDALAVDLTPSAGGDTVHAARDPKKTDRAWFDISVFPTGRFVVTAGTPEFQAEYTSYGSGVPITGSTRGVLTVP